MYNSKNYDALTVAEHIVNYCNGKKYDITHRRLQNILFALNGEYLKKHGCFLTDDDFYARLTGPRIRAVYRKYAINGGLSINKTGNPSGVCEKDRNELNALIEKYAKMTEWDLQEFVNGAEPYLKTIERFGKNSRISKYAMWNYFERILGTSECPASGRPSTADRDRHPPFFLMDQILLS